jgi:hypothetical protein
MEKNLPRERVVVTENSDQFVGYANVTGILLSPDDLILHFGQRNPQNPKEGKGIAKIYLGLPHAKRLLLALSNAIEKYESTFGEIVSDPGASLKPEQKAKLEQE